MGIFSKKIQDPDFCFIRDLMEVITVLSRVTSVAVGTEFFKQVITEYNLQIKAYEYTHLNYNALDCYPSDSKEKFKRAQELLQVAKILNLPGGPHSEVIGAASACIKKMGFSYQEKIELINTCIVELSGIESIDEFIIGAYINDL